MHWFFTTHIEGALLHLTGEEARHCSKVLRMQMGDKIQAFDGLGNLYTASIDQINKREVTAQIFETNQYPEPPYQVHLAIAPTKNISRLEWCIEKSCELGITSITPLLCEHSERKIIKPERLDKIILSAIKQSQKTYLPTLQPLTKFNDYLRQNQQGNKYICHCAYEENTHLANMYEHQSDTHIMIGPEGDFSPTEVSAAVEAGFLSTGLGKERLRTETAGVYSVSVVHTLQNILANKSNS